MKNFYLVFKQSFRERITSKSYLLTTLSLILITIFALSLPSILDQFSKSKETVIFVANEAILSLDEINQGLPDWEWREGTLSNIEEYKKEVQAGDALGVYILNQTQNNYVVEYYAKGNNVNVNTELTMYLQSKKIQEIAFQNNMTSEEQQSLFTPVSMVKQSFTEKNEVSIFIIYIMLMFILMAIMMYGTTVATGVASEKASRVMEVMVTKVNPLAMIFGKIFGIALAGLVQFTVFFVAVGLYIKSGIVEPAESLGNFELNLSALTIQHCIYFFVFFLLGYFLYASIYAVFGSMVSRPEELNGTTMPITILLMASAFSGILFVLENPTTIFAKILSIVPFTSPFNMIILIMKDSVSNLEIITSIGILLVTTFIFGYMAAKIYPKGILHFGENLKLRQLLTRSS